MSEPNPARSPDLAEVLREVSTVIYNFAQRYPEVKRAGGVYETVLGTTLLCQWIGTAIVRGERSNWQEFVREEVEQFREDLLHNMEDVFNQIKDDFINDIANHH